MFPPIDIKNGGANYIIRPVSSVPPPEINKISASRIDWKLIESLDLIQMKKEKNLHSMKTFIKSFCSNFVISDDVSIFKNALTPKLFHLCQIVIEYLVKSVAEKTDILQKQIQTKKEYKEIIKRLQKPRDVCPICRKVFKIGNYLDKHIKLNHSGLFNTWMQIRSYIPVSNNDKYERLFNENEFSEIEMKPSNPKKIMINKNPKKRENTKNVKNMRVSNTSFEDGQIGKDPNFKPFSGTTNNTNDNNIKPKLKIEICGSGDFLPSKISSQSIIEPQNKQEIQSTHDSKVNLESSQNHRIADKRTNKVVEKTDEITGSIHNNQYSKIDNKKNSYLSHQGYDSPTNQSPAITNIKNQLPEDYPKDKDLFEDFNEFMSQTSFISKTNSDNSNSKMSNEHNLYPIKTSTPPPKESQTPIKSSDNMPQSRQQPKSQTPSHPQNKLKKKRIKKTPKNKDEETVNKHKESKPKYNYSDEDEFCIKTTEIINNQLPKPPKRKIYQNDEIDKMDNYSKESNTQTTKKTHDEQSKIKQIETNKILHQQTNFTNSYLNDLIQESSSIQEEKNKIEKEKNARLKLSSNDSKAKSPHVRYRPSEHEVASHDIVNSADLHMFIPARMASNKVPDYIQQYEPDSTFNYHEGFNNLRPSNQNFNQDDDSDLSSKGQNKYSDHMNSDESFDEKFNGSRYEYDNDYISSPNSSKYEKSYQNESVNKNQEPEPEIRQPMSIAEAKRLARKKSKQAKPTISINGVEYTESQLEDFIH